LISYFKKKALFFSDFSLFFLWYSLFAGNVDFSTKNPTKTGRFSALRTLIPPRRRSYNEGAVTEAAPAPHVPPQVM
jgi:hypothetical protein